MATKPKPRKVVIKRVEKPKPKKIDRTPKKWAKKYLV